MSDRLLRDLGDLARSEAEAEEARFGDRWDRLAAGTLTADEEAELKALAESSPEAHEMYEAFRPLGADFQMQAVSAIRALIVTPPPDPFPKPDPVLDPLPPPPPDSRVLTFIRRSVRRVEVWGGAAAAMAAGVFLAVRIFIPPPPLPGYQPDKPKVQSEYRGPDSETATPGSSVTLTVRPDTAVQEKVETRGFLSCAGGDLHPWELRPSSDNPGNGIVILQGTLDKGTPPGSCKILIVIARKGKFPRDLQAELRAGRTGNGNWRTVSENLKVGQPIDP